MSKLPLLLSFLTIVLVFSCKPQVPKNYIQPDDFEDILYDFHLADAMADTDEGVEDNTYDAYLNRQAVLKKYKITQADFDSSMVYYMRHSDRLHQIYENLSDRFSNAALALGASANDINRYGDMTLNGDTANVWAGASSCILMPEAPFNVMTFALEADTTYHEGDNMILSFNTDFMIRDGSKNGTAMLAVQFKDDEVANRSIRLSANMNYSMTVSDSQHKGIKSIRGFIYMFNSKNKQESGATNLLFVDNIHLVRMHVKESEETKPANTNVNANKTDSVPDNETNKEDEKKHLETPDGPVKLEKIPANKQEVSVKEDNRVPATKSNNQLKETPNRVPQNN